ncbi:hypothetical protein GCM10010425_53950 [Streptomyces spororaveus]|uniref:NADH-ubiquinone oxidoreductase n=1 Tax=Streptomyces spororaveus TaxID=284039 RepID=A0ABQ3T3V0_9ACTN|nr:hypothetical protein Sspor_06260 [Streptomyces spororaveus]
MVWDSRPARKRGTLSVRSPGDTADRVSTADPAALRRLRRLNAVASGAFVIGGALFAVGAAVSQFGSGDPLVSAWVYLVGGVFFSTGGYVSILQVLNAPRHTPDGGSLVTAGWRWWGYEPMRVDWLSMFVLFTGTLVFGVNLLDSFLEGLTVRQVNRLIWTPDVIGCVLFLVSGHLGFAEICHRPWPCVRSRSLGWWVVAVNQLGSILFMVSALAAYTRPATGSLVNVGIANWATLTGALCFSVGGVLQLFERP